MGTTHGCITSVICRPRLCYCTLNPNLREYMLLLYNKIDSSQTSRDDSCNRSGRQPSTLGPCGRIIGSAAAIVSFVAPVGAVALYSLFWRRWLVILMVRATGSRKIMEYVLFVEHSG